MKNFGFISSLLFVLGITAACGSGEEGSDSSSGQENNDTAEEIVVEHELGETAVEKNPESVVVFDFGSLDTLDTLGVEIDGLPKENIPSYLETYEGEEYENVGGVKEPDFEKIATMAPDLIVISGRQQESFEELSKIAPTIYLEVDTQNYMDSFKENVNTLATLFGKEKEAEEHVSSIEESVESLHQSVSSQEQEALITLANDGKVSAYGSGSRFGIIHDEFGFPESDENIEASTHGQSVSFEYIAQQDPDYLFVIDRGAVVGGETSAQQIVENDLTEKTQAYQNDNIVYLNPEYWYLASGGIQSVSEMVKEIESVIE
ncbi:siderophore ABC transporter substrate-binding protein [Alteribacillus iranensis]|uniref:Iron complex transport system substrate-binding protein n=1 Tax=Alteribacillus iranensis TaxID=930128 RepID=A0A1I2ENX3_9BACI|nr:siderophore ABC transporter substrate-binding protein [Alteribacillus iranensis]SFE94196.1 iron complex transport system substrate-binding protein [Alteribacillus iranensis]